MTLGKYANFPSLSHLRNILNQAIRSRTLNSNFDTIIKAECNKFKSPNRWKSKLVQRVYKRSIEDFELRIQKQFSNDGRKWGVEIGVDAYFSEPLVDEGCLILEDEQILACFTPVLEKLMEMVESQRAEIKRKGGALKEATTSAVSVHFLTRGRQ